MPSAEPQSTIEETVSTQHCAIVQHMRTEFDLAHREGLFVALAKTFAVPSISEVLVRTGGFEQPDHRLFSTHFGISTLYACGYASSAGQAAITRIKKAHAAPGITNDKLLYVLSLFVNEPLDALARVGPRTATRVEELSMHTFWNHIGQELSITDIPDYDPLRAYRENYEIRNTAYHPNNAFLAERLLSVINPQDPFGARARISTLPKHIRHALGYDLPQ